MNLKTTQKKGSGKKFLHFSQRERVTKRSEEKIFLKDKRKDISIDNYKSHPNI